MVEEDWIDPKMDVIFKKMFGVEQNQDMLLQFLDRILSRAGHPAIKRITYLNPYTEKDSPVDKQGIMDIKVQLQTGELINIEMQLDHDAAMVERTLHYWADMYYHQKKQGTPFSEFQKCIVINILATNFLHETNYHNIYRLLNTKSHNPLKVLIEAHFIELTKFNYYELSDEEQQLGKWLFLLQDAKRAEEERVMVNEEMIQKAFDVLEYMNHDDETREAYRARLRFKQDEASRLYTAEQRGLQQGLQKGLQQGLQQGQNEQKIKIARMLLQEGKDLEYIAQLTELDWATLLEISADLKSE